MTSQEDSFDVLKNLLINKFGVDANIVSLDTAISELGLDSLTLMEFIFAAEDAFNIRIPEEKLNPNDSAITLNDVCKAIDGMKNIHKEG